MMHLLLHAKQGTQNAHEVGSQEPQRPIAALGFLPPVELVDHDRQES